MDKAADIDNHPSPNTCVHPYDKAVKEIRRKRNEKIKLLSKLHRLSFLQIHKLDLQRLPDL